jgi:hypothetical protein
MSSESSSVEGDRMTTELTSFISWIESLRQSRELEKLQDEMWSLFMEQPEAQTHLQTIVDVSEDLELYAIPQTGKLMEEAQDPFATN